MDVVCRIEAFTIGTFRSGVFGHLTVSCLMIFGTFQVLGYGSAVAGNMTPFLAPMALRDPRLLLVPEEVDPNVT